MNILPALLTLMSADNNVHVYDNPNGRSFGTSPARKGFRILFTLILAVLILATIYFIVRP